MCTMAKGITANIIMLVGKRKAFFVQIPSVKEQLNKGVFLVDEPEVGLSFLLF